MRLNFNPKQWLTISKAIIELIDRWCARASSSEDHEEVVSLKITTWFLSKWQVRFAKPSQQTLVCNNLHQGCQIEAGNGGYRVFFEYHSPTHPRGSKSVSGQDHKTAHQNFNFEATSMFTADCINLELNVRPMKMVDIFHIIDVHRPSYHVLLGTFWSTNTRLSPLHTTSGWRSSKREENSYLCHLFLLSTGWSPSFRSCFLWWIGWGWRSRSFTISGRTSFGVGPRRTGAQTWCPRLHVYTTSLILKATENKHQQ